MFQDALHATEGLDHVRAVVIEVPQLAVVLLMRPPKWVLLEHLVLLEICPDSPADVIGQDVLVLLEEGVHPRNASVPAVLQVLQR